MKKILSLFCVFSFLLASTISSAAIPFAAKADDTAASDPVQVAIIGSSTQTVAVADDHKTATFTGASSGVVFNFQGFNADGSVTGARPVIKNGDGTYLYKYLYFDIEGSISSIQAWEQLDTGNYQIVQISENKYVAMFDLQHCLVAGATDAADNINHFIVNTSGSGKIDGIWLSNSANLSINLNDSVTKGISIDQYPTKLFYEKNSSKNMQVDKTGMAVYAYKTGFQTANVTNEVNLTTFDCTALGDQTVTASYTDPTSGATFSQSFVVTVIAPGAADIRPIKFQPNSIEQSTATCVSSDGGLSFTVNCNGAGITFGGVNNAAVDASEYKYLYFVLSGDKPAWAQAVQDGAREGNTFMNPTDGINCIDLTKQTGVTFTNLGIVICFDGLPAGASTKIEGFWLSNDPFFTNGKGVTGIKTVAYPTNVDYLKGQPAALDTTGLAIDAVLDDGSMIDVTKNVQFSAIDTTSAGQKTVVGTFTYLGKSYTTTFSVYVDDSLTPPADPSNATRLYLTPTTIENQVNGTMLISRYDGSFQFIDSPAGVHFVNKNNGGVVDVSQKKYLFLNISGDGLSQIRLTDKDTGTTYTYTDTDTGKFNGFTMIDVTSLDSTMSNISDINVVNAGNSTVSGIWLSDDPLFSLTPRTPTGISVSKLPNQIDYALGDKSLNKNGLVVNLLFSDGSSSNITNIADYSGFDTTSTGEKRIDISYLGFETSFSVDVYTSTARPADLPNTEKLYYQLGTFESGYALARYDGSIDFYNCSAGIFVSPVDRDGNPTTIDLSKYKYIYVDVTGSISQIRFNNDSSVALQSVSGLMRFNTADYSIQKITQFNIVNAQNSILNGIYLSNDPVLNPSGEGPTSDYQVTIDNDLTQNGVTASQKIDGSMNFAGKGDCTFNSTYTRSLDVSNRTNFFVDITSGASSLTSITLLNEDSSQSYTVKGFKNGLNEFDISAAPESVLKDAHFKVALQGSGVGIHSMYFSNSRFFDPSFVANTGGVIQQIDLSGASPSTTAKISKGNTISLSGSTAPEMDYDYYYDGYDNKLEALYVNATHLTGHAYVDVYTYQSSDQSKLSEIFTQEIPASMLNQWVKIDLRDSGAVSLLLNGYIRVVIRLDDNSSIQLNKTMYAGLGNPLESKQPGYTDNIVDYGPKQATQVSDPLKQVYSMKGVVLDKASAPLEDATLTLNDSGVTATTDGNGKFVLDSIGLGDNKIVVKDKNSSLLKVYQFTVSLTAATTSDGVVINAADLGNVTINLSTNGLNVPPDTGDNGNFPAVLAILLISCTGILTLNRTVRKKIIKQ